jgi:hypothetical protein
MLDYKNLGFLVRVDYQYGTCKCKVGAVKHICGTTAFSEWCGSAKTKTKKVKLKKKVKITFL